MATCLPYYGTKFMCVCALANWCNLIKSVRLIAFTNHTLGLPYEVNERKDEYSGGQPDADYHERIVGFVGHLGSASHCPDGYFALILVRGLSNRSQNQLLPEYVTNDHNLAPAASNI